MQAAYESLSTSDSELWRAFKAGVKTAFAQIYEQHAATLYNYGRHISPDEPLVKDCIHELFIELWHHRNNLGETDSIKFYLFKSLRRKIIYEAKRKRRLVSTDLHQPLSETITVSLPYEFPHVEAHLEKVHQQKLLQALEALPKRQREVIHLLFFDNLTREEVASLMDIDLSSIYTLTWKALQSENLDENTIIVFTSDHGFHLGEHGLWCKTSNFELDARVPLIMSIPGNSANGKATDNIPELIDLYPTLVELCGLTLPAHLPGQSLLQVLHDPHATVKELAFIQHLRPSYDTVEAMGYSVRTPQYRYTEWRAWQNEKIIAQELYDHSTDEEEMQNIVFEPGHKKLLEDLSLINQENFTSIHSSKL